MDFSPGELSAADLRFSRVGAKCDPDHGVPLVFVQSCNHRDGKLATNGQRVWAKQNVPAVKTRMEGPTMSGYSLVILVCSVALSHSDCQPKTARDIVRGPEVDNTVMCGLNAQMMIARTDLVRADGTEYMKVVCTPSKNADQWTAEVEARKAALQ
jgi:hypothetical protein